MSRFVVPGVLGTNPPVATNRRLGAFPTAGGSALGPTTVTAPQAAHTRASYMGSTGSRNIEAMRAREFLEQHELNGLLVQSKLLNGCSPELLSWVREGGHAAQNATIWQSADDTVIFRVDELSMDDDGGAHSYHEPTNEHYDGRGVLGSHSLLNAVTKNEAKKRLTEGCGLLRDYFRLKTWMAAHPHAQPPDLAEILRRYSVASMDEFATKARAAICVEYISGRPKSESQADWDRANVDWCGIATDARGRRSPPQSDGFYIPKITPHWARPEIHPWVVRTAPLHDRGVELGDYVAVIRNGERPRVAFGIVADANGSQHVGESSIAMLKALGFSGKSTSPKGDYVAIAFPGSGSVRQSDVNAHRRGASEAFAHWSMRTKSGLELVRDLFPTKLYYDQMKNMAQWGMPGDYRTTGAGLGNRA